MQPDDVEQNLMRIARLADPGSALTHRRPVGTYLSK